MIIKVLLIASVMAAAFWLLRGRRAGAVWLSPGSLVWPSQAAGYSLSSPRIS